MVGRPKDVGTFVFRIKDRINMNHNQSTNQRIAHLESTVTGISTRIDGIDKALEHQTHALNSIATKLSNRGTDWKMLASWASVLIALMTVIGGMAMLPMRERVLSLESTSSKFVQMFHDHELKDAHPVMIERVDRLEKDLEKLDIVLQREMRLLDDVASERVEKLDVVLQRELQLNDEIIKKELSSLKGQIKNIKDSQRAALAE